MNYIPLCIKTNYDLLCSLIKLDDLIKYAKDNEIKTLGICDPKMFSCMEFYTLCKNNDIKPIVGVPLIINDVKFNVYPRNNIGYCNTCNLVTISNLSSLTREDLNNYKSDIIVVLDSDSYKYYNLFSEIFDIVYLSYKNDTERMNASLITDKIVFMNEVRMFNESDSRYLRYLYLIRDSKTIKDDIKYEIDFNYFINEISLVNANSTIEFSKLIEFEINEVPFKLPKINENDSKELLRSLCVKGLNKRLNGNITKEYKDRLEYELSVIENMGFVDYFLVVYDFILYAKKNNILVGPGRGSAAGSLVAYTLGIIEIDPLKYNLIFERFLNPDRISLPDIDIDIEDVKRDKVKEYLINKYGTDKVANVIAFGTLLPKAVIRDVGRILNMDSYLIDNLCKTIKGEKTFKELEKNKFFTSVRYSDSDYETLLNICFKLEGLKSHTTVHAAGVVISESNISNVCPLYSNGEMILTSYTKDYIESLGLIKMDLLAITNLTIIKNVLDLIKENLGINLNLNTIPLNDKKTLDLFKVADTIGIFQFESGGIRNVLRNMQADTFDDLVAIIALYRPGPMSEIPTYINRKHGKEKITYLLDDLEPILKSTYGVIVYQEQVLEILRKISGFTYSEADIIRKAMSKKKESVILESKDKFINGALKNGYDKEKILVLFDKILKFSEYAFNKSHSVAYSLIGYWMQYLKANYKEYYMSNLLNSVIGSEIKTSEYIDECKLLDIDIVLPDINISDYDCIVKDGKIILPLSIIKNVGNESTNKIIDERNKNGKFTDYFDFIKRVTNNSVNKKVIESLIDASALKCFNLNKKTLTENMENALNYASLCKEIDDSLVIKPEINITNEYDESILMQKEFSSLGFYYSNHPIKKYRRDTSSTLKDVKKLFNMRAYFIVLVDKIRVIDTKDKEKMAFLTVSDEYAKMDAVIFPSIYQNNYDIKKGDIIRIYTKIERRYGDYQLVINKIDYLNRG